MHLKHSAYPNWPECANQNAAFWICFPPSFWLAHESTTAPPFILFSLPCDTFLKLLLSCRFPRIRPTTQCIWKKHLVLFGEAAAGCRLWRKRQCPQESFFEIRLNSWDIDQNTIGNYAILSRTLSTGFNRMLIDFVHHYEHGVQCTAYGLFGWSETNCLVPLLLVPKVKQQQLHLAVNRPLASWPGTVWIVKNICHSNIQHPTSTQSEIVYCILQGTSRILGTSFQHDQLL